MLSGPEETSSKFVTHVVGARPNFPKAAPVIKALSTQGVNQRLVHTGQHYDDALSASFFRDLQLPTPDVNLGVGSATHAQQTAALLVAIEDELVAMPPQLLVVYGDINSTLAAALVASKLGIPVAHVEAGLRSFDRSMPEEINRLLTDQLSSLLFTTSADAQDNLRREGVRPEKIHFVGNPMIDTLYASTHLFNTDKVLTRLSLEPGYVVATIHRPSNVDDPRSVVALVEKLHDVSKIAPLVIPLHPRGRNTPLGRGLNEVATVKVIEPLGYIEFISLLQGATAVITDSGGVQEESTVLGLPCLTLRPNTERPVTISEGTNKLVTLHALVETLRAVVATSRQLPRLGSAHAFAQQTPALWDGAAGHRIAALTRQWLDRQVQLAL